MAWVKRSERGPPCPLAGFAARARCGAPSRVIGHGGRAPANGYAWPRTSVPGFAPVGSPSSNVTAPDTTV